MGRDRLTKFLENNGINGVILELSNDGSVHFAKHCNLQHLMILKSYLEFIVNNEIASQINNMPAKPKKALPTSVLNDKPKLNINIPGKSVG